MKLLVIKSYKRQDSSIHDSKSQLSGGKACVVM